jgi:HPt (histidine-containing phosphotransfer) domain-containing protein
MYSIGHGLRGAAFVSLQRVLFTVTVLTRDFCERWATHVSMGLAFVSTTSAEIDEPAIRLLQPQIKLPPLALAEQFLLHGGWGLLVAGAILGVVLWRSKYRRRLRSRTTQSVAVVRPSSSPPILDGVDLRLLWFMSDENAEALPAEIERYIAAFEGDLQLTHAAVLSRSSRDIHRGAHRLVAHSAAINYEPLHQLATKLQSDASSLEADQLDRLIAEFDLRFGELKKTLRSIQFSTERE